MPQVLGQLCINVTDLERSVAFWEDVIGLPVQSRTEIPGVLEAVVQSPAGGTLKLMRPLFSAGLGGRLGDGQQWFSWIGIDDLVDIYHRGLWDPELTGAVNAVAPQAVRNAEYTKTLAHVLHRPAVLPVPALGPRVLLGAQGAQELALANQRVIPARLNEAAHPFRQPDLESALRHVLGK